MPRLTNKTGCFEFHDMNNPWEAEGVVPQSWFHNNFKAMVHDKDNIIASAVRYKNQDDHDEINDNYTVYFLIDEGVIVYIGKSTDLMYRLSRHCKDKYFTHVATIGFIPSIFLEEVESFYIKSFDPYFNIKRPPVSTFASQYL